MADWKSSSGGNVPSDAWQFGNFNGSPVYVVRATHEGHQIPGIVSPPIGNGKAYISWGRAEYGKSEYEVLCGNRYSWVGASGSNPVPGNAISGGFIRDDETLYIGHVSHNGVDLCGRVQLSRGKCYCAYLGNEVAFDNYDVLVLN